MCIMYVPVSFFMVIVLSQNNVPQPIVSIVLMTFLPMDANSSLAPTSYASRYERRPLYFGEDYPKATAEVAEYNIVYT